MFEHWEIFDCTLKCERRLCGNIDAVTVEMSALGEKLSSLDLEVIL